MAENWDMLEAESWPRLSPDDRREVLAAIAGALGQDLEVADGEGEPALRLRHRSTGLRLQLVPGGRLEIGLSQAEEEALADLAYRDPMAAPVLDFLAMSTETLRPVQEVRVPPFLLAQRPLGEPILRRLLGPGQPAELGYLSGCLTRDRAGEAIAALAGEGLRLPSESEWEHAYRAGTRTPFPWGAAPPATPLTPRNDYGFDEMGELAELCADGWHPDHRGLPLDGRARSSASRALVVRGGAAELWPWQGCGEWVSLLSAHRSSSDEHEGFLAIRPALSLCDDAVVG
ncbi:MAG: hypothetical protein JXR96_12665 [Deltaproteobacteria bacterium]|nr:hypothetical protein [Deltaproteobacteria bacterium]